MSPIVLTKTKGNEKNSCNEAHRPADLKSTQYRERLVDLREIEIRFRVEEHADHRDTADEMSNTEDETRREAVEPLVCLIEGVCCRDWPSMPRFDSVNRPEGNRTEQQPEGVRM